VNHLRYSLSTAVILVAVISSSAAGEPLTLSRAVESALGAHPSVQIALARSDAAEAAIDEAAAGRWPQISVTGSVFHYEEPMVVTPIHGFGPDAFPEFSRTLIQNALHAELLLWDGGGTRARIHGTEAEAAAARAAHTSARDALILRTSATYLTVLTRHHLVQAHDSRLAALDAERSRVAQLIDVGRAPAVDMLRIEAALAAAAAERSAVSAGLEAAERDLARLIGLPHPALDATDTADVELAHSPPAERETLARFALENNPSVQRARDELRARQSGVAAARSISLPQVRAVGSWLQFGDSSVSFDDEWNVGIRVRIPLWDGGATSARVTQAMAAVRAAEEQVRLEEHRVLERLDAALASWKEADANVESLATATNRFEEVVRIEKLRLDSGAGTQTDYLQSEADLLGASAGLAASRYRRVLSRIELAHALGELDPGWFDRHIRSDS
jgi:outer membrane protein TolC